MLARMLTRRLCKFRLNGLFLRSYPPFHRLYSSIELMLIIWLRLW